MSLSVRGLRVAQRSGLARPFHSLTVSSATGGQSSKQSVNDDWLANKHSLVANGYPDVGLGRDKEELLSNPDIDPNRCLGTNHFEKKAGRFRLRHSIDTQIRYMDSDAYKEAYRGLRISAWYRRNYPRAEPAVPPPPLNCLHDDYSYKLNNSCVICRDEYLWFDYRNPRLLEQFMIPGTLHRVGLVFSRLCQEQYDRLQVEIWRAVDAGQLVVKVPHRTYDYREHYPQWATAPAPDHVSREEVPFERPRPADKVIHPAHDPDVPVAWDPYWTRWDDFAEKV